MSNLMSRLLWWRTAPDVEAEQQFLEGFHGILESEAQRRKMPPSMLAIRLSNCDKDSPAYILLEHELNRRIARIQAVPTYVGIVSGLFGVVLGAWLNSAFQSQQTMNCTYPSPTAKSAKNETLRRPTPSGANAVPKEPIKLLHGSEPASVGRNN
jgi:hypothetical protein